MAIRVISFPSLNISTQVGDEVYYAKHESNQSGTNMNSQAGDTKPKLLGIVTIVDHAFNKISVDDSLGGSPPISTNMYYMIQKPKSVNTSGITGYYAEAEYRNYTSLPCEMFATAIDYSESSK